MPDIGHHAHHPPAPILRHDLSNRVLSRPEGAGQGLVHDHDRFARCAIPLRESSSGLQTDPGGLEVSIAHYPDEGLGMLVLRVNLSLAGDLPRPVPSKRQNVGQTGRPHAWERARPLQHVIDDRSSVALDSKSESSGRPGGRPLLPVEIPDSTSSTRRKLRISSPAPTSKVQANAISETTSPLRTHARLCPPLEPAAAIFQRILRPRTRELAAPATNQTGRR